MKIYVFTFLFLLSFSVYADKVIIANCAEGKGCSFELSDIEADLLDGDFERNIQPDDIVVLGKKKNGEVITYLDKKSRTAIDKEWGGDGYTQLGLFNPQIQPLSGLWQVDYGLSSGNDCYGIGNVGNYIRKIITPGKTGNSTINFPFPFSPSKLFPSPEMRWRKAGYNTYKGTLDFNSNQTGGMKMHYTIQIISEKEIKTVYRIEIKVPTKPLCIGLVPVNFKLLKAKETDDTIPEAEEALDDLLPVNPGKDDLLPVNPKKDDLLPVEPGKKPKPHVPLINDKPKVPRIED